MPAHHADPDSSPHLSIRVLFVVHDVRTMMRFRDHLLPSGERFKISQVSSLEDALVRLRDQEHDVALVDLDLPEAGGRDVLHRIRVASDVLPIVALFDEMNSSLTIDALRLGAQDCLSRYESDSDLVVRVLQHAVERHRLLRSLREARAKEHHEATHDSLTLLPNRQAFLAGLANALASAQRRSSQVGLLFFDLDGFKAINDALGHDAGDALLAEIGKRLRRVTRQSDLVARLGGDEFVVALNDVDEPRAIMRPAELFIETISAPFSILGQECRVGVSIGAALFPGDAQTAETLIRAADLAMYNAKQTPGSNVRFYQEDMDREVHERFALVANVRDSTRRKELFLEFQPQIDVLGHRLLGAEALLRWLHPERGRLAPSEFLGIAEDTGMMREIGSWVLHEACETAAGWGRGPNGPFVAVNVSSRQLSEQSFVDEVSAALAAAKLPPNRLVIEMTERGMVDRAGNVHSMLEKIAGLGVTLAVDHFGGGAGSLGILQSEAIRMLKIDRSLLDGVGQTDRSNRIVTALLAFARRLDLQTVAEGVETVRELRALRFLGCAWMQGFLLGKPVSAKELLDYIEDEANSPWRKLLDQPEVQSTKGSLDNPD